MEIQYWQTNSVSAQPVFHAEIAGKPSIWGTGSSVDEAIGDMVRTHPKEFEISIFRFIPKHVDSLFESDIITPR